MPADSSLANTSTFRSRACIRCASRPTASTGITANCCRLPTHAPSDSAPSRGCWAISTPRPTMPPSAVSRPGSNRPTSSTSIPSACSMASVCQWGPKDTPARAWRSSGSRSKAPSIASGRRRSATCSSAQLAIVPWQRDSNTTEPPRRHRQQTGMAKRPPLHTVVSSAPLDDAQTLLVRFHGSVPIGARWRPTRPSRFSAWSSKRSIGTPLWKKPCARPTRRSSALRHSCSSATATIRRSQPLRRVTLFSQLTLLSQTTPPWPPGSPIFCGAPRPMPS